MHIAFISTQFVSLTLTGGLGNHLLRVGLSLVSMGHKPTIFMISDQDVVEEFRGIRLVQVAGKPASLFKRLLVGTVHANAYQSKKFRAAINEIHKIEPIDIIQYTNYRSTALYRAFNIPAVMRISSYRPLWDPLHPTALKKVGRKRAASLELKSFFKVDSIYAPSRVLAEAITKDTGINVDVIEPPFIMDEKDRDKSIINSMVQNNPFFFFAGSLTKRKGAEVIAKSVKTLLKEYPQHYLVFVGKTEETSEGDTLEIVKREAGEYSSRVLYHEPVPHSQLYPFYENSDLVFLPSIIDNIANTGLEAMALGSVVVGTDGGSFEQLIEDGKSGFLCIPGDTYSFIDAVHRGMKMSEGEREIISKNAKSRIKKLSPEHVIPKLLDYYRKTISDNNN